MTDSAYQAKEWLNRLIDLFEKSEQTKQALIFLESKVNNAVANYENTGRGKADLIVRQEQHEDLLIAYSIKREQYEKEYMEYVRQEFITMNVLERMKNRRHAQILFGRHINRMTIDEMEKSGRYGLKRSRLYSEYRQALDDLGQLLKTEEPQAIKKADATIKEYFDQKRATA